MAVTVTRMLAVCVLLACGGALAEETPISLASPQDYQVVQRRTRDVGDVVVRGTADVSVGDVEVRVGDGSWHAAARGADGKAFTATIAAPAGGWYAVEARAAGGASAARSTVAHVGVGEVFVVAGQSNSCNYGAERQSPTSGKVAAFDGQHWSLAADPEPGGGGKGGSFMPAFGDAMVARLGVPVGVAACGIGSTSVRQWLPKGAAMANAPTTDKYVRQVGPGRWEATGEPFDRLMRRIEALGPRGCRAVLWHQGESDAGQARGGTPADRQISGEQYRQFLEQLIRASRQRATWDVPWFVAQATYHSESDPADDEFRAAQKAVWDDGVALPGPDTDALGPPFRAGVHFNAKGLAAHGKLWADKVGPWVEKEARER